MILFPPLPQHLTWRRKPTLNSGIPRPSTTFVENTGDVSSRAKAHFAKAEEKTGRGASSRNFRLEKKVREEGAKERADGVPEEWGSQVSARTSQLFSPVSWDPDGSDAEASHQETGMQGLSPPASSSHCPSQHNPLRHHGGPHVLSSPWDPGMAPPSRSRVLGPLPGDPDGPGT